MAITPMRTGIIGCGNISNAYFGGTRHYQALELAACADLDLDRARAKAEEHKTQALSVEELLARKDIELVVNLTVPAAHAEIDIAALNAGKHVYSEKPLARTCKEAEPMLALAAERKLLVGCAADTFLGGGIQTCRKLIDEGAIGKPVGAVAFMACAGHESWHPSPAFYYQVGGGPLLDMGPYYLGALVNLLGPVRRVGGAHTRAFDKRQITSQPLAGTVMDVEIATHISATLEFECGAVGSMLMSFDVLRHSLPRIEIYGSEGALSVPDPNTFGGPVRLCRRGDKDWEDIELTHEVGMRGAGPADMVHALASKRPHRASGALAFHLLDVMESIIASGDRHETVTIQNRVERPAAVPAGLPSGTFD